MVRLVGWLRVVCVFFYVCAVLDPEVFYPDVLMNHWACVVLLLLLLLFSRGMCAFLRYSLLKFHNSSEFFFTFHFGPSVLALFPGACAFAYDRGVRFPGFFQLASSLLGFSYRAAHIRLFFGFVFGRLVTHRYIPVCQ